MTVSVDTRKTGQQRAGQIAPTPTLAAFGNSWVDQGVAGTDLSAKGFATQVAARLYGRLYFTRARNFGYSGQSSTQIMQNLPSLVASGAQYVLVEMLINDPTSSVAYSESVANINQLASTLEGGGMVPIFGTVPPRSDANNTSAVRLQNLRVNDYLFNKMAGAACGSLYVADVASALTSRASSVGAQISGVYNTDNVHPIDFGAYAAATPYYDILNAIVPQATPFSAWRTSLFDRTNYPTGWVTANPSLFGSTGTVGAGITGSVADNFTLARTSGTVFTATASKATGINGGEYQQIVLGSTATTGAAAEIIEFSLQTSSLQAGDVAQAIASISATGLTNVLGVYAYASSTDIGTFRGPVNSGVTGDSMPSAVDMTVFTDAFTKTTTAATVFKVVLVAKCNGVTPAGTVTIKTAGIKVISAS